MSPLNNKRPQKGPSKERALYLDIMLEALAGKKLDLLLERLPSEGIRKNQVYNLCYGVARRYHLFKSYIDSRSKRLLNETELLVTELAMYEIFFNESAKPYAVISEALKLLDVSSQTRSKSFINALLGACVREPVKVKKELEARPLFPVWILKEANFSLKGFLDPSPFFILVNEQRTSIEELRKVFDASDIAYKSFTYDGTTALASFDREVFKLKEFNKGHFIIQDLSSQYAINKLCPKQGMKILDLCSAPGGKAIKAAINCNGKAKITALDRSSSRLLKVHENISRLGISCIDILEADAATAALEPDHYDMVIVDPPCSALGVLGRNPDIALFDRHHEWPKLPELQFTILTNGFRSLRPGGRLLYSVCTFREQETRAVIERACDQLQGFNKIFECLTIPNEIKMDGLYMALVEKK